MANNFPQYDDLEECVFVYPGRGKVTGVFARRSMCVCWVTWWLHSLLVCVGGCTSLLGLPCQKATDWGAYATEMVFSPSPGSWESRIRVCVAGSLLLKGRYGLRNFPPFAGGQLFATSSHAFTSVWLWCLCVSKFPLLLRTLVRLDYGLPSGPLFILNMTWKALSPNVVTFCNPGG